MGNTLLGMLIMLLATSLTQIGAVIQKKAVDGLPAFEQQPLLASVRSVLRSPGWLIGWLLGTSALVLNMVALGLADISLIQPLNGFGLVVLAIVSRLYLKERLGPASMAGMALVVAGVVLVGASAQPSRVFAGAPELLGCYVHGAALAGLGGLLVLVLLLWLLAARLPGVAGILFALAAATCSVAGLTFSKGFFGLLSLLGAGGTFRLWPAYLLLGLLLTCSIAALMVQQLSFQKGRAVVVTPVFAATSVVLPLLTGRLVFGEQLGGWTLLAPPLIVLGVVLLGSRSGEARPALVEP